MKVLIGCERSGIVRNAFRKRGHDAYSNDIVPSDDNSVFHIQDDVLNAVKFQQWDLAIFHPPCTYLTIANRAAFKDRLYEQIEAIQFVESLWLLHSPLRIAIENPVGVLSTRSMLGKPTQYIQPWMFGHGEMKQTCLWLRNLAPLQPTYISEGRYERINFHCSPANGLTRSQVRSITYEGIADAMAEQWGKE